MKNILTYIKIYAKYRAAAAAAAWPGILSLSLSLYIYIDLIEFNDIQLHLIYSNYICFMLIKFITALTF